MRKHPPNFADRRQPGATNFNDAGRLFIGQSLGGMGGRCSICKSLNHFILLLIFGHRVNYFYIVLKNNIREII